MRTPEQRAALDELRECVKGLTEGWGKLSQGGGDELLLRALNAILKFLADT